MTDSLVNRLIRYILNHHPITLDRLTEVATSKGFTEEEVLIALEQVHADKRVSVTNLQAGVTYRPAVSRAPKVQTHLQWWRSNYPAMDETNDGSGIEIDLGHLFLRTKEERDAYKQAVTGRPVYTKGNDKNNKKGLRAV